MGWTAIKKSGEVLREETHGRPVQEGEEGQLKFIFQEDFGNKVGIDLINGVIIFGYDSWGFQGDDVEIYGPRTIIVICDETTIVGEIGDIEQTEPDENGTVINTFIPLIWRPIWFTRYIGGEPTKVVGAQTTLPQMYGGRNVKKLVSIFNNGKLGID
jgi:hypothetical protein